jgi:hypothetical protein
MQLLKFVKGGSSPNSGDDAARAMTILKGDAHQYSATSICLIPVNLRAEHHRSVCKL